MTGNATSYPDYEFVPSIISNDGQIVAMQYQNPYTGAIVTNITNSKEYSDKKNALENQIQQYASSINTFSPETLQEFENIAQAKKQSAIDTFDSIYEPVARSSREDYFSRLGTLDSTAYLDRQDTLEKSRQKAYADIANDYVANLDTLKNNELSNRYNYLNYLQNSLNNLNNNNSSNYLSAINSISSNYTNSYNNYLADSYNSNSKNNNSWYSLGNSLLPLLSAAVVI